MPDLRDARADSGRLAVDRRILYQFQSGYRKDGKSLAEYREWAKDELRPVLRCMLGAEEIGITLSEEDQLDPEQSNSAIVAHHPQAKYFSV